MPIQPLVGSCLNIGQFYSQKLQEQAADSQLTFKNIETPGWSSLVHTEESLQPQSPKQPSLRTRIMQKLNSNEIDLTNSHFIKLRLGQNTKTQNILLYEQQKHKINCKSANSNKENDYQQRCKVQNSQFSDEKQNIDDYRTSRQTIDRDEQIIKVVSLCQNVSNLKRAPKSCQDNRNYTFHRQNSSSNLSKRFNHISVHQHLFQQSKRMETKKLLQQIIEEQYLHTEILPFHPQINPNSKKIAEIRNSRIDQQASNPKQTAHCPTVSQTDSKVKQQKAHRDMKQPSQSKINILFKYLSREGQIIDSQSVQSCVEQLPLACVRFLSKILSQVYAGSRISQRQFTALLRDKKVVSSAQGLISTFLKWQIKQNKQKERTTSTTVSCLDL